jgi:predicted O-methyltransferase YrrM
MFFEPKFESLLAELEALSDKYWNISREAAFILFLLIRKSGVKNILEIGTSSGYSALWMARALRENNSEGKIVTVESHAERFNIAAENFRKAGLEKLIVQVKGHAPEVFDSSQEIIGRKFDLVFFDATKEEYVEYFTGVLPFLAKDAMIIADNVLSHREKLDPFFCMVEDCQDFRMEVLDIGKGLMVIMPTKF